MYKSFLKFESAQTTVVYFQALYFSENAETSSEEFWQLRFFEYNNVRFAYIYLEIACDTFKNSTRTCSSSTHFRIHETVFLKFPSDRKRLINFTV